MKRRSADKMIPSSSASLHAGPGTALSTFYAGPYALQLASTLPTQPFLNHGFPVRLYLIDGHGQVIRGQKIPLLLQMAYIRGESTSTAGDNVFSCDPPEVSADTDGMVAFTLTFLPPALTTSNRIFVFRVNMPTASSEPDHLFTSKPMCVVTQRLVVASELDVEKVWYKDEGGREHGIELALQLMDEHDTPIHGTEVPLVVQLLYFSGEAVTRPNMMTLIDSSSSTSTSAPASAANNTYSNIFIDRHGTARLRVRINDISKNHQRQLFKVRVSADSSRNVQYNNIGSTETVGIEVKSKRTKRMREPTNNTMQLAYDDADFQNSIKKVKAVDKPAKAEIKTAASEPYVSLAAIPTIDAMPMPLLPGPPSGQQQQLLKWTELVLDRLQAIRWKHIGYQSTGPGVNTGQPLYNIVNPNAIIDGLLQYYHDNCQPLLPTNGMRALQAHSLDDAEVGSSSRRRTHSLQDEHLGEMLRTFAFKGTQDEQAVHYILAIPYHILFGCKQAGDQLYFPAYDAQQSLLGLYVELKDDRSSATIIHFLPLSTALITSLSIRPPAAMDLLRALLSAEQSGVVDAMALAAIGVPPALPADLLLPAVYSLKKHGFDLEAMKQDALVHYWLSQVAFDDF